MTERLDRMARRALIAATIERYHLTDFTIDVDECATVIDLALFPPPGPRCKYRTQAFEGDRFPVLRCYDQAGHAGEHIL